jgi:hypothetical protein
VHRVRPRLDMPGIELTNGRPLLGLLVATCRYQLKEWDRRVLAGGAPGLIRGALEAPNDGASQFIKLLTRVLIKGGAIRPCQPSKLVDGQQPGLSGAIPRQTALRPRPSQT